MRKKQKEFLNQLLSRLTLLFPTRFKGLPGAEKGLNPNAVGGSLLLFLPLLATLAAYFMRRENRARIGRKLVHVRYPFFNVSPRLGEDTFRKDIAHCHNQMLQTALDLGIPGLIAYVAIWAATFRLLWHVWRKTQDPYHRAIALGLAGGLLAQFVFGITDAIALGAKAGIFWWIALAMAVSLEKLEKQVRDKAAGSESKSPKAWEAPLLWVLISLLSISFVGAHLYVALAMAIAGGIYLGLEVAKSGTRIHAAERK